MPNHVGQLAYVGTDSSLQLGWEGKAVSISVRAALTIDSSPIIAEHQADLTGMSSFRAEDSLDNEKEIVRSASSR